MTIGNKPKVIRYKLPLLVAPMHFRGKFNRYTPLDLKESRDAWCAEQARKGYPSYAIAIALGINTANAYKAAIRGGWVATDIPRWTKAKHY